MCEDVWGSLLASRVRSVLRRWRACARHCVLARLRNQGKLDIGTKPTHPLRNATVRFRYIHVCL